MGTSQLIKAGESRQNVAIIFDGGTSTLYKKSLPKLINYFPEQR
jgi:hypothetical protein